MTNATSETGPRAEAKTAGARFLGKFTVLKGATRELWITFAVKLLVIAAYALTNSTLVLWLSSDLGYSDQDALRLVAAWSLLMTVFTLLVGSLTDAIGLRKTFFLGVWICIVARAVMAFTSLKWLALASGLFPLAVGEALSTPVLVAAVRRYSTTGQRSISFSLFYVMMNVGFLAAALLFDFVRQGLGEHGQLTLPVLYFLRVGVEVTDEGVRIIPRPARERQESLWEPLCQAIRESATESVRLVAGLLRQAGVYRLLAFLILIAFLKLILMQMCLSSWPNC